MIEPFMYNGSSEHKKLVAQMRKEANGHCYWCNKPLTSYYQYMCNSCKWHIKARGLEYRRVGFTEVGLNTINYQQLIHRKFFNCSAPYKYRGKAENRVKTMLSEKTIDASCKKLDHFLSNKYYRKELYNKVKHIKNSQKRILYWLTLYSISYFILNNKDFASEVHFQASIIRSLDNNVNRLHYRARGERVEELVIEKGKERTMKVLLQQYEAIMSAVQPLLLELSCEVVNK